MDEKTDLLFVYGTLRQGGSNHHYLEKAKMVANSCWVYGELHDTGFGYPVLKENNQKKCSVNYMK